MSHSFSTLVNFGVGVQRRRGSRADPVSEDDILRAIAKLGVLGGGFAVVKVGERRLVRTLGLLHHDLSSAARFHDVCTFLHMQVVQ